MRADNTHHLIKAARARAEATRCRALAALRRLDRAGTPFTFDAVAREAGVSRSWLYNQPDLRAEIDALRARTQTTPERPCLPTGQRASDESLRRRLEAATHQIRELEHNNQQLRQALAEALGEARSTRATRGAPRRRDTPGRRSQEIIGPC